MQLEWKHIGAIALLLVLLAPVWLVYGWMHCQKRAVRHEVKEKLLDDLPKENLVLLKFTQEQANRELHWEHEREFEYQDQMYDVVKREVRNDTLYYWCWPDEKETALNQQLAQLTQHILMRIPQRQEKQLQLEYFYKSLYLHDATLKHKTAPRGEHQIAVGAEANYLGIAPQPPCPPPRFSPKHQARHGLQAFFIYLKCSAGAWMRSACFTIIRST